MGRALTSTIPDTCVSPRLKRVSAGPRSLKSDAIIASSTAAEVDKMAASTRWTAHCNEGGSIYWSRIGSPPLHPLPIRHQHHSQDAVQLPPWRIYALVPPETDPRLCRCLGNTHLGRHTSSVVPTAAYPCARMGHDRPKSGHSWRLSGESAFIRSHAKNPRAGKRNVCPRCHQSNEFLRNDQVAHGWIQYQDCVCSPTWHRSA